MLHGYLLEEAYRVSDTYRIRIRVRYASDTYPRSIRFFLFSRNSDTCADTYRFGGHGVSAFVDTAQPNKKSHIPVALAAMLALPRIPARPHRAASRAGTPRHPLAARRPPATSLRSPATSTRPCSPETSNVPARQWTFRALRRGSSSSGELIPFPILDLLFFSS